MKLVALVLATVLIAGPHTLHGQEVVGPEIWQTFAARLEPGKVVKVRLKNGQRFKATLLDASDTAVTLQPKTRAAVPPQRVPYESIETLEVDRDKGARVAKAVAVGAAVAVGTFFGLMAIVFSAIGD
jgi:hypothetical protein